LIYISEGNLIVEGIMNKKSLALVGAWIFWLVGAYLLAWGDLGRFNIVFKDSDRAIFYTFFALIILLGYLAATTILYVCEPPNESKKQ